MRWHGHVLRINEERIPNKVLNMKVKRKHPTGRPRSRWEQQVWKHVTQKETEVIILINGLHFTVTYNLNYVCLLFKNKCIK
jgi:hypothetical protein